ncbi:MAG: dependent ligase [Bacteroidetes bacterium]|nr:dependent ligase [Bacteroidota bacterium]
MALKTYNTKRNFKKTPEPEGKKAASKKELTFVVQQHDASHLHYDFRLEMEGVLKSWAVPKGPSMNPEDKRLAMMVEDHPYSYKDFEGTIPEGNYGAGNVIVWDNGTYHEAGTKEKAAGEKKLLAGLRKGHISFVMKGKKLKGEFALIKIRGGKQENAWLLVKKEDKYSTTDDILAKNKSVISKKKLELKERKNSKKPAAASPAKKTAHIKNPVKKARASAGEITPMLATLTEEAFDSPDWVFELKYDGYRALALIAKGNASLVSRNNISFDTIFAALLPELKKIPHDVILDGEVVVEDAKGNSGFQLLQNFQTTGKGILKFYVFDILLLDGEDTRGLSLLERKELVKLLLKKQTFKNIHYSEHIVDKGKAFYKKAMKEGIEGIMAKRADSIYVSGKRSKDWLKVKITQEEEAVIAGFTAPKGSRKHFGSLLLGAYKGNELKYIGNCGTGFNEQMLKELYTKLVPLSRKTSVFKEKTHVPGKIQWVEPELICQVKFSEWTNDQHMRHPVFLGLRIDKDADEITVPETAEKIKAKKPAAKTKKTAAKKTAAKKSSGDLDLKAGNITLHLTNQDKIYFPKDKITKGDLVNYYREAASVMLPYLKGRPQSMNRFPNGITGPSFYQKDVDTAKSPGWLTTEKIFSESTNEYIDYLVCNDEATLLYMANLGCIEINPWNSKIGSIENPDWAVIDLDPEAISFKEVVKTALEVKKLMDELEADCYCKTSGASGLHVFIPLGAKYNYDIVKTFAELIAQTVNARIPSITSILRSPKKRQKKVYLDFLQNRRGQTLAAPYSVRPKPGATVATPLEWKEVNSKLDPSDFTIKTILKRLDKKGDLWKPVTGKGADLMKILKKMNKE